MRMCFWRILGQRFIPVGEIGSLGFAGDRLCFYWRSLLSGGSPVIKKRKTAKLLRIGSVDEIPEGGSKKFNVARPDRVTEAFIFRKEGRFYAYLNLCRHWTVGLDFDDNDFFSEGKEWLVCKNHGALYRPETGVCESGPCGGASLYQVPLLEKGRVLYAEVTKIDWGDD